LNAHVELNEIMIKMGERTLFVYIIMYIVYAQTKWITV